MQLKTGGLTQAPNLPSSSSLLSHALRLPGALITLGLLQPLERRLVLFEQYFFASQASGEDSVCVSCQQESRGRRRGSV